MAVVILCNTSAALSQVSYESKSLGHPVAVQSFLPGTLVNWTAVLDNNKVLLNWTTTVEVNTKHFTIEKSFDGTEFMESALLFAAGNSNIRKQYVFSDKVSINVTRVIYYRLKMVDMDGNVKYSDIRTVRGSKPVGVMLEVFPNPTVNDLKLTISSTWINQKLLIEVCNINGVVVKSTLNQKAREIETLNVQQLPKGMYIVKVSNGTEVTAQQFLKN